MKRRQRSAREQWALIREARELIEQGQYEPARQLIAEALGLTPPEQDDQPPRGPEAGDQDR